MDFNQLETTIIEYWQETNLQATIMENNINKKKFDFVDGPPFLTGTMHHGHALVSFIKDVYARYMAQQGYATNYQLGFDTHGLPIEQEVEKIVGRCSPTDDIEKIKKFCDACRFVISTCSSDWFEKLGRLGRQFDRSETYYTCSFEYMKSLWWAFGELYKKGLIYRSKKVMPYSAQCMTPLSNFEAAQNYIEKTDLSVYVKFRISNTREVRETPSVSNVSLLVFTTTPWSLFANQGICVNPDLDYVLVCNNEHTDKMWLEESCYTKLFNPEEYHIIQTVKGKEMVGIRYNPIFPIPNYKEYMVYADPYVEKSSGTGIVHLAPLFGADDMRVMKNSGYTDDMLPEHLVDSMVRFKINYDINGNNIREKFVMDTSTDIVIHLKELGYVHKSEKIKHMYPYCYRTDTPLIYLATDAWFLSVTKLIPDLIANNNMITWAPSHVGERFGNWIKDAPDWCLSRNRVWGTPIPIWINEHGDIKCIQTVKELEKLTGRKYDDLHLDSLGDTTFQFNNTTYKRTFGILDCWFESGMAPLSRHEYPTYMNKEYHKPVDFIAESLDQTRGWFYTLNVLSTALYNMPAFKSVVVSGLILAADGKKMSKRLKNYTSPDELIQTYGADVIRLYSISSPASKAESFAFNDMDLNEIKRKLIPYYNAISFYLECKENTDNNTYDMNKVSTNLLDRWLENKFMEFAKHVYSNMKKLQHTYVPNLIYRFIDNLCNVYIKLSRDRLKGNLTELDTLYSIINRFNVLIAPFMPHLAEHFNLMLGHMKSVHLESIDINYINMYELDMNILNGFCSVEEILEAVRNLRLTISKPIFYPLNYILLYTDNMMIAEYKDIVCRQLNVKELIIKPTSSLKKIYRPNKNVLGKTFKKDSKKYEEMILAGNLDFPECNEKYYTFEYEVTPRDDFVGTKFNYTINNTVFSSVIYLNSTTDEDNMIEAIINNVRRQVNSFRKEMGLKSRNKIELVFDSNEYLSTIDKYYVTMLSDQLGSKISFSYMLDSMNTSIRIINTFNDMKLKVNIIIL